LDETELWVHFQFTRKAVGSEYSTVSEKDV
jgi:hypothetical protein